MKFIPKYKDGFSRDAISNYKPEIIEPIEKIVNGKKYSDLSFEEKMYNLGNRKSGYPKEEGLKLSNPEFDIITLGRSIATLPKKFFSSSKIIHDVPGTYYRQTYRSSKGIEDAMKTGIVSVKSAKAPPSTAKISLRRKAFDVPFWGKDKKWFGYDDGMDIAVSRGENGLNWQPINKDGFETSVEASFSRRTPIYNGGYNNTPSKLFEFYRHYPALGFRNVTNGFPHAPVTGVSTINDLYKE